MRRVVTTLALGTAMVLGTGSAASAAHTGCEHGNTQQAHDSVPHHESHHTHGTHTAHSKIPYCAPQDAPGRG